MRRTLLLGTAAAALIALGSYGAGATRNHGGVMRELGLGHLTFGHGRALFDIALTGGIILLIAAWVVLGRELTHGRAHMGVVRRAVLAWSAPLVFCAPILSRDVYSYLMQGAMLRDGFDPYTEGAAVNPGPLLLEVSHDWRNTTTPYGPLHLGIGTLITTVVGDNVSAGLVAYKLVSVAGFALIAYSVPRIASRIGGNPALAVWLGVANPLMLLHMLGGMHNEAVMVGLVCLGLSLCLGARYFTPGIALIALAVSLKATAAIALPFVVWMMYHRYRKPDHGSWAKMGIFVAVGAWSVVLSGFVVNLVTVLTGASWGWLAEISGNSKVVNPLAGPTLVADLVTPFLRLFDDNIAYNTVLAHTRSVATVLMLIGLVATWVVFRPRGAGTNRRAIMGTTAAYAVAFVTNSVTLPWYYASVLATAGTCHPPVVVKKVLVAGSVFVGLAFTGDGNHRLYEAWFLLLAAVASWLAAEWIYPARRGGVRRPSPGPGESPRGPRARGERQSGGPEVTRPR
ncbi:alpha-(1-_6)-mannopyranosyltransferase A [Corynebacterium timonense]|uniref:Alpha-(1->6)-mannopyranosyltransferase A n=1 Tax=Corynebacterium timonense TaxID=441500 RepID=A0A1H1MK15_9CORY|nr:alpha-(1->6)-mannopyranosyltransferase A [Corynebacterium timonense]SDR86997.1 alpha-1,6-mannosyltransferase [Corynebacterium timonense]